MARFQRLKKLLQVTSRGLLASLLIIVWFAPSAPAQTVCSETETGWECTIIVDTVGDGPEFTFVISESTEVTITTYTSLTCNDHGLENGSADPYIYLYDDNETLLYEDDDSAPHNNGTNFCWDSQIQETLDAGTYVLKADVFDEYTTGTYSMDIAGGDWTVPQEEPEPTPEPTPVPEPEPTPEPEPEPTPDPTPQPTPQPDPEPAPAPPPPPIPAPPTPDPEPIVSPPPPPPTPAPVFVMPPIDIEELEEEPWDDDITWEELELEDYDFEELEIEEIEEEEIEILLEEPEGEWSDERPLEEEEEPEIIEDDEILLEEPEYEDLEVDDLFEEEAELLDEVLSDPEEIEEFFEDVLEDNEDFFEEAEEEQLEELFETAPALFNEAPDEVKDEFESEVNIFDGGFDDYVAEDSTITVEERRVVVAATTVSAVASARPAVQSVSTAGPSIPRRRKL